MIGRPPIFETPEELEDKVNAYFALPGQTITISGLAFYLGFESRQSFYDYEKKPDFSYIIKRARIQVEISYEERLDSKNPTGAIFALKNMGWDDRTQIKHEGIPDQKITYLVAKPTDD